jgi:hypothetical protein
MGGQTRKAQDQGREMEGGERRINRDCQGGWSGVGRERQRCEGLAASPRYKSVASGSYSCQGVKRHNAGWYRSCSRVRLEVPG